MKAIQETWQRFSPRARIGLAIGCALIIAVTAALGVWAVRTDYQVLFADLTQQDAAGMVAELDRLKIPYRLSDGGATILVPADMVHKTRLSLVGKDLPLHGAIGFELFNNSEIGMTEFAQRVNYQRALQGELTRTILSLGEIQSARVHLVLPEQGLFKKAGTQAKASITLTLKPGKALDNAQVHGIQRLVGAAVPDIKPDDVTIVDQRGNALTRRAASANGEERMALDGLDDKRALEAYLTKKVTDVLDRTFGAGQATATVDVTLNRDHTKVTTEEVVGNGEQGAAGIKVRERHNARRAAGESAADAAANVGNNGLVSREIDYQVGRRVEQVVSLPGAIDHFSVAVVVRKTLDAGQLEKLKEVVAMAAGVNKERGDAIAVYSVEHFAGAAPAATDHALKEPSLPAQAAANPAPSSPDIASQASAAANAWLRQTPMLSIMAALGLALVLAVTAFVRRRRRVPPQLSPAERERVLAQLRNWLAHSHPHLSEPRQ